MGERNGAADAGTDRASCRLFRTGRPVTDDVTSDDAAAGDDAVADDAAVAADAADDNRPLDLSGRLRPEFTARTVAIEAGSSRHFDEAEWRDALVVVQSGEVEVETISGCRRRFGPGDILFLTGLSLVLLHNLGPDDVVLRAVSRRRGTAGSG